VFATLSLFLVVPLLAVVIFRSVDTEAGLSDAEPLVWAERTQWPRNQFTVFKSLERGQMSSARTNRVHQEKLSPDIAAEAYLAIQRCAALASRPREAFMQDDTRTQLIEEVALHPDLFYGHYLLATWHALYDQPDAAEARYAEAFAHAPAVLMRRHAFPGGNAAASAEVPEVALVVDRVIDDRRDPTLVLIYPHLEADDEGFIYLPVFKAILRHRTGPEVPGLADTEEKPQWFSFFGRVGRMPDLTLR
jgi:hypothetical protein